MTYKEKIEKEYEPTIFSFERDADLLFKGRLRAYKEARLQILEDVEYNKTHFWKRRVEVIWLFNGKEYNIITQFDDLMSAHEQEIGERLRSKINQFIKEKLIEGLLNTEVH